MLVLERHKYFGRKEVKRKERRREKCTIRAAISSLLSWEVRKASLMDNLKNRFLFFGKRKK